MPALQSAYCTCHPKQHEALPCKFWKVHLPPTYKNYRNTLALPKVLLSGMVIFWKAPQHHPREPRKPTQPYLQNPRGKLYQP